MFSLKEWNFEEYKAAAKEIEDPVDRLDELDATRGYAFFEVREPFMASTCCNHRKTTSTCPVHQIANQSRLITKLPRKL